MLHNTRTALVLAVTFCSALTGCIAGDSSVSDESAKRQFNVSDVQLAATAGVSGKIWTLESYDDGTAHPGLNAIDIGASGGAQVWHQLGALPAEIGGGWMYVDFVQEKGYCSQYNPGDTYYNGAKLRVFTYFYGVDGQYLGHHSAVYQHVVPADGVKDTWLTWNNASAGAMWASPNAVLGNKAEGGVNLGTLFSGGHKLITNGPNGKLCHQGDHLHQEGMGARATVSLDDFVTGRVDGAHVFGIDPIVPSSPGYPPSAPPAVGSAPPSDPQDPPANPQDPPAEPQDPTEPAPTKCACKSGVDNFCFYAAQTPGCAMTFPGGYCDPNGDGNFGDGNWEAGWYDFLAQCDGQSDPEPQDPPADPEPAKCECKSGVDNFCNYAQKTPGCDMTFPGGYCDPNGDGDYSDASWENGWYDFHDKCGS